MQLVHHNSLILLIESIHGHAGDVFRAVVKGPIVLEYALKTRERDVGSLLEELQHGSVCLPSLRERGRWDDENTRASCLPFMTAEAALDARVSDLVVLPVGEDGPAAWFPAVLHLLVGDHLAGRTWIYQGDRQAVPVETRDYNSGTLKR